MSRLAKRPVALPDGVTVTVGDNVVAVKGAKGELQTHIPTARVTVKQSDGAVLVSPKTEETADRAASGLVRSIVQNLVTGITDGFTKELEFTGVGYRAEVSGQKLTLNVGYSHPVVLEAPEGISLKVQKNKISVTGADRQAVGQFAANVRAARPPEPYKGKGIRYADEQIRRKAGKAGKAQA